MDRSLALALVVAFCPAAFAQGDAVTIKIKKLAVGDKAKETKLATEVVNVNGTAMGQVIKEEQKKTTDAVFSDEVLEIAEGAKKPTKFNRTYQKAEVTTKGMTNKISVEGKTVLVVRGEKSNTYTIDGKPVPQDAEQFLNEEFSGKKEDDSFEMLLPKDPVKAGDTWKIDIAKVTKSFEDNMEIDASKSKGTGKLIKTYKKGDAVFGLFEVSIELAVTKFGTGAQAFPVKPGTSLTINFTMDGCLDGSEETGKATMTMKGKVDAAIPNVELTVDLDMKMDGTREQLKK
jgi:predicted RNA-binding protein with TRAM domain